MGTTHSFISMGMAKELGLKIRINTSKIKAINSQAKHVEGMAWNVRFCLGDFEGRMDWTVIKMDNFELIIGNTFMRIGRVGVFSQLGGVMVMNKADPCFVRGQGRPSKVEDRIVGGEQLTTMQLAHGSKRGDLTYFVVMLEIQPYRVLEVLDSMVELLDEFADVMPLDLLDALPPKRLVENRIELVSGTKALGKAPYRMSLKELTKLKIQRGSCSIWGKISHLRCHLVTLFCSKKRQMGPRDCVLITRGWQDNYKE